MSTVKEESFCLGDLTQATMRKFHITKDPRLNHYNILHLGVEYGLLEWPAEEHNLLIVNLTPSLDILSAEGSKASVRKCGQACTALLLKYAAAQNAIEASGTKAKCHLEGDNDLGDIMLQLSLKNVGGISGLHDLLRTVKCYFKIVESAAFQRAYRGCVETAQDKLLQAMVSISSADIT